VIGKKVHGELFEVRAMSSIPDALISSAEKVPTRSAISEPDGDSGFLSIDYRSLAHDVDTLAKGILELAGKPVVGVVGRNGIAWSTVYLATLRTGGVIVPIDRELPISEIHTILHYSGACIVFYDESFCSGFLERGSGFGKNLVKICMNGGLPGEQMLYSDVMEMGRSSSVVLPRRYDINAPAAICYTSGTTGKAKGVVLSQRNLLANIRQMYQFVELDEGEIFLSVLPVHHTYECTCGFLGPVLLGKSIVIGRGLRTIVEDMVASEATIMLAVPLLWEAMYRRIIAGIKTLRGGALKYGIGLTASFVAEKLGIHGVRRKIFSQVHDKFGGTLRMMISGGAAIDPEVVSGFEKLGFTFLQGYGLTETSPIISLNRICANRISSVGLPVPEVEVLIDERDESDVGEIVVRGPNIMLGYHNDPEATLEVLSKDGWFRTGDFGYLDADGFLFITGRKKNVIVAKNGKNVYPEEIETVLNRSEYISESMVFGRESTTKGEEIWVVVVPGTDVLISDAEEEGRSLSTDDVVKTVRNEIHGYNTSTVAYRRISRFIIREGEFPRTTTRKIRRREVFREAGLEEEITYRT